MNKRNFFPGIRSRIVSLLFVAFLLCAVGVAHGGWKQKIVRNQIRVADYITALQEGGNPDKIERPTLRRDKNSRANAANRELREMMDEAEDLARNGKHDKIKDPEFSIELVSEDTYQAWEKEYRSK